MPFLCAVVNMVSNIRIAVKQRCVTWILVISLLWCVDPKNSTTTISMFAKQANTLQQVRKQ